MGPRCEFRALDGQPEAKNGQERDGARAGGFQGQKAGHLPAHTHTQGAFFEVGNWRAKGSTIFERYLFFSGSPIAPPNNLPVKRKAKKWWGPCQDYSHR